MTACDVLTVTSIFFNNDFKVSYPLGGLGLMDPLLAGVDGGSGTRLGPAKIKHKS
jgi:hypothetical protein